LSRINEVFGVRAESLRRLRVLGEPPRSLCMCVETMNRFLAVAVGVGRF
jgi:hypothetical protein